MVGVAPFVPQSRVKLMVRSLRQHRTRDCGHWACNVARVWVMEIFLHVGAHRTGTTGFQSLLQHQRARLRRSDVSFWGPQRTRSGFLSGLIKNPDYMTTPDVELGQRSCGRIAMEIERLYHEDMQTLILSEENMIGTMTENLASCSLYGQAQSRLARFAPAFEGHAPQIWLAIRSYERHWASQLAFRIKAGALVPCQAEIDTLAAQTRDWQEVIRSLQQAIPAAQVVVWRFEDWATQPAALLDTLLGHQVGLRDHAGSSPSNASASAPALAELVLERGDASGAKHLATNSNAGRYMPFNPRQQTEMQHLYCDDLAWLRAGADGCATYLDPTEGTFGGHDMTEGSPHERQEASVASPR